MVPLNSLRPEAHASRQPSGPSAEEEPMPDIMVPPADTFPMHELPPGFLGRVQGLGSHCVLHVPPQFRQ